MLISTDVESPSRLWVPLREIVCKKLRFTCLWNPPYLYRIRLCFFWRSFNEDVNKWVKGCADCFSYNVWRNTEQEIHLSWTLTIPFYIMHVDIWSPGNSRHGNKPGCHTFSTMCDLTQFIISSVTTITMEELLATLFMDCFVLSNGAIAMLVVDTDIWFKGYFEAMWKILHITHWQLLQRNHKGNSVENINVLKQDTSHHREG